MLFNYITFPVWWALQGLKELPEGIAAAAAAQFGEQVLHHIVSKENLKTPVAP